MHQKIIGPLERWRIKRLLLAVAFACLSVLGAASCGGGGDAADEPAPEDQQEEQENGGQGDDDAAAEGDDEVDAQDAAED